MLLLLIACGGAKTAAPQVGPGDGRCGGIAGFQCPDGHACIDDPTDSCDPDAGGRDCMGKCVPCAETGRTYLGDPEQCARMKFGCDEGSEPFFDECGCGCA